MPATPLAHVPATYAGTASLVIDNFTRPHPYLGAFHGRATGPNTARVLWSRAAHPATDVRAVCPSELLDDAGEVQSVALLTRACLDGLLRGLEDRLTQVHAASTPATSTEALQRLEAALVWGVGDAEELTTEWDALDPVPPMMRVVMPWDVVRAAVCAPGRPDPASWPEGNDLW